MWLVPKNDPDVTPISLPVEDETRASLLRLYADRPAPGDQTRVIDLLFEARQSGAWIACDCRQDEQVFPLLTPVYVTTSASYYLRRLNAADRPQHKANCLFHRDDFRIPADEKRSGEYKGVAPPDGFFSVLTPEDAQSVSPKSFNEPSENLSRRPPPKLARLLWRFLSQAGANKWGPVQYAEKPTMNAAFADLRRAAEQIDVNADTALARVIGFHPDDYHSNRLFARIRAAKRNAGARAATQGFLCLYTKDVKKRALTFSSSDPIAVLGELARPAREGDAARAPYLTLTVVGEAGGGEGLAALRAYAQPIYSAAQLMPVDSGFERAVIKLLNSLRWSFAKTDPHIEITLIKPLFDMETPNGPCRPDVILEARNTRSGAVTTLLVEAMGRAGDPDYEASKAITHPRMATLGRLIEISPSDLSNERAVKGRVARALREVD